MRFVGTHTEPEPGQDAEYGFAECTNTTQPVTPALSQSDDRTSTEDAAIEIIDNDYASITTSFGADIQSLPDDDSAASVIKEVHITDQLGELQSVNALLDTGATRNFISEAKHKELRLETRRLESPLEIDAAGGPVNAILVAKGKWQLAGTPTCYTNAFYVLRDLPYDIILCRQVICQQKLLEENLELCSLGLPQHLKNVPELYIMSLKKLSSGKYLSPLNSRKLS